MTASITYWIVSSQATNSTRIRRGTASPLPSRSEFAPPQVTKVNLVAAKDGQHDKLVVLSFFPCLFHFRAQKCFIC